MIPEPTCQAPHDHSAETDEAGERLIQRMAHIRHKIMILSGKGGVGKSTVAANLAVFLSGFGWRTGLLDIDLHGPSIPKLLGLEGRLPGPSPEGMLPVTMYEKLKVMSIGFLLGEEQDHPIFVRGPMKHKLIQQFLADVVWGDLDYLIVDSPPGTGDEPLSIAQLVHGADGADAARNGVGRRAQVHPVLSPSPTPGDRGGREHERTHLPALRARGGAVQDGRRGGDGAQDRGPLPG